MTPRWYRTRWFWLGLLGLGLWVGAWVASFAGNSGHLWSWSSSTRVIYFSHGAGWAGAGFGESQAVRYPSMSGLKGWRSSKWDLNYQRNQPWFPPVKFTIVDGKASLWMHYGVWITAWTIAWLLPLACWHRPRSGRVRPPRFPGTPRRWFASPFLWAGLPGCVLLAALWTDSVEHRSAAGWRWTRGYKVEPNYLGFGAESNRGQVVLWAGRGYEGAFFHSTKPGLFGERKKSTGEFFQPEAKARKGARRFQVSYGALAGAYLVLWVGLAGGWQYRQRRVG